MRSSFGRRGWGADEDYGGAGLSTPLILSSMALDITLDGACQLIRSYLADRQAWAYGGSRSVLS